MPSCHTRTNAHPDRLYGGNLAKHSLPPATAMAFVAEAIHDAVRAKRFKEAVVLVHLCTLILRYLVSLHPHSGARATPRWPPALPAG